MENSREGLDFDRLGVLTGAMLLTLALTRLLVLPARPVTAGASLGLSLNFHLSVTTIMALLMLGLSLTGVESLVRSHPEARAGRLPRTVLHWILPGLLGMTLAIWLEQLDDLGVWTLALLASIVPLPLTLAVEYSAVAPQPTEQVWVQWGLQVLAHLIGLLSFYVIFAADNTPPVAAAAILASAGLLSLRLLWPLAADWRRALRLASLVGLLLALAGLLLGYLPLTSLRGALLLLLGFYLAVGLLSQRLAGRLDQGIVVEYAIVALAGLAALVFLWP